MAPHATLELYVTGLIHAASAPCVGGVTMDP